MQTESLKFRQIFSFHARKNKQRQSTASLIVYLRQLAARQATLVQIS